MVTHDFAAARLALLASRACLSRAEKIRHAWLRLPSTNERFTPEQIVERLAAAPKPLECSARNAGGSVEITFAPLVPGTHQLEWHERVLVSSREHGGFMGYLDGEPLNTGERTVYCVGLDESLLLPVPALRQWHHDYAIKVNYRADRVSNALCVDLPEYREAKSRGAIGIIIFSSPADNHAKAYIQIHLDE